MIAGLKRLPRVHSEQLIYNGTCTVHPKRNRYGGPRLNMILTSRSQEMVDCRVCMYWLKLYVPLTRLREHQEHERLVAEWDTL